MSEEWVPEFHGNSEIPNVSCAYSTNRDPGLSGSSCLFQLLMLAALSWDS